MRAVAMLTISGLIALVVAVLTGSTPIAVVVVGLAIAGIVLLLRDWRDDRSPALTATDEPERPTADAEQRGLSPDEFSPDISSSPAGPSSDARADQP